MMTEPHYRLVCLPCVLLMAGLRHVESSSSSSSSSTNSNNSGESPSSSFYQRYKVYPPYCGDPAEMATRSIPPLMPPYEATRGGRRRRRRTTTTDAEDSHGNSTTTTTGTGQNGSNSSNSSNSSNAASGTTSINTRLVHVTAIIRHGARTPAGTKHPCWKGFWDEPDGIWDCDLKTLLATRPDADDVDNAGPLVVAKIYDALVMGGDVEPEYQNNLNGTCQMGQLIQQGYDQQVINGKLLRQAYIYNGGSSTSSNHSGDDYEQQHDPRLRLWDTTDILDATSTSSADDYPFSPLHLRYRSDDDQRTLASGQILLTSMFGPELEKAYRDRSKTPVIIPHHTADRPVDILSPRSFCSNTKEATNRAQQSDEYKAYNNSRDAVLMRQLIADHLAAGGPNQDCLMTTICTDRSLPDVIDDYTGEDSSGSSSDASGGDGDDDDNEYTKKYGANRFVRLRNFANQGTGIIHTYNDSEFSKQAMGPLWAEIMDHITPVIARNGSSNSSGGTGDGKQRVKFALYSGHDSTLMPLMASLGPRVWNITNFPYYASMMLLEIHEVLDEGDKASGLFPSGYAFRLVYNGKVMTELIDGYPSSSSPDQFHLCDVRVLTNRVSGFATRKDAGCGKRLATVQDANHGTAGSDGPPSTAWSTMQQSSKTNPRLLLAVCMVASFVLSSLLTCIVANCCQRRVSRTKQRAESELVMIGDDDDDYGREGPASDPMDSTEEPDVVID